MENKTLETMTVKELREECKKRGLTISCKERRFTKPELIERILKYDAEQKDITDDIQKSIQEVEENEMWDAPVVSEENKEVETELKEESKESSEEVKTNCISFATTLEEIETKYGRRKPQHIYDEELKIGCFVVFMRYIETLSGKLVKKLGSAKVIGINRGKELVRVETPVGETKEMSFEELFYIKSLNENRYPTDIYQMLKKQRDSIKEYKERRANRYEGEKQ